MIITKILPGLFLLTLASVHLYGQDRIKVSLSVTEQSDGILQSAFASALRNLGDVEIVAVTGSENYRLDVVSTCDNKCGQTSGFSLAMHLSQPIDTVVIKGLTIALGPTAREAVVGYSAGAIRRVGMWAASWSRNSYEQQVREFVATLNAQCFEQHRMWEQAVNQTDGAARSRIVSGIAQRQRDSGFSC